MEWFENPPDEAIQIHRVVHGHSPMCFEQSSQIHLYITVSLLETSWLCVRSMQMDNVEENKNRTMPKQRKDGRVYGPTTRNSNQSNQQQPPLPLVAIRHGYEADKPSAIDTKSYISAWDVQTLLLLLIGLDQISPTVQADHAERLNRRSS